MKPEQIVAKIVEDGKLKDESIGTLTQWIIKNEGKETVSKYLQAIEDDEIRTLTPEGKARGKVIFERLHYSPFFNGLAVRYSGKGWFDEARSIFEGILARTPNDVDTNLNYGATIVNKILSVPREGKRINKRQLETGRSHIFRAFRYDKKVHDDWRTKPAYKDLCYTRAIEAVYYLNKKETFTAFVLGWMSIEMSLYRILFKAIPKTSESRVDELMRWDTESIIETLHLCNVHKIFKDIKKDLDTLKGTRNHLLHGDLERPTVGESRRCIETAMTLIPILQGKVSRKLG